MQTAQDFIKAAAGSYQGVDSNGAQQLLAAGAVALDVREPFEFEAGHIPEAINLPRGVIEFMLPNHPQFIDLARDSAVVVYCKTSGRSILAAHTLKQMGFSNLYVLEGGFDNWQGECQQVERDPAVFN